MTNRTLKRMPIVATVLIFPALFVAMACGGDDSSSSAGSDASFVKDLCGAFGKAQADFDKLQKDPSLQSDNKKAATEFGKVLDTLTGSLSKARPPKDASNEFNQALTGLKAATAQLKNGDPSGLNDFKPPAFAPDVTTRLQKVAGNEKTCNGLDLFIN